MYGVMRHEKYNAKDKIRALQAEANREWENEEWYRDNVNLDLSYRNVSLVHCDDFASAVYNLCANYGVDIKDDSVLLIGSVYTASPEFFEDKTDAEIKDYFEDCLQFHSKLYGKVISAEIHMDQATPHMHIYSVPILQVNDTRNAYYVAEEIEVENKKTGLKKKKMVPVLENGKMIEIERGKLLLPDWQNKLKQIPHIQRKVKTDKVHVGLNGNKAIGGKKQMSEHQTLFWNEVTKKRGLDRGECRIGLEPKVHISCAEHNRKVAEQKLKETERLIQTKEGVLSIKQEQEAEIDRSYRRKKAASDTAENALKEKEKKLAEVAENLEKQKQLLEEYQIMMESMKAEKQRLEKEKEEAEETAAELREKLMSMEEVHSEQEWVMKRLKAIESSAIDDMHTMKRDDSDAIKWMKNHHIMHKGKDVTVYDVYMESKKSGTAFIKDAVLQRQKELYGTVDEYERRSGLQFS